MAKSVITELNILNRSIGRVSKRSFNLTGIPKRTFITYTRPSGVKKTHQCGFHKPNQYNSTNSFHSTSQCQLDDPYKVLGVNKDASSSEIKKSYYKLAKKYHPDINKEEGAEKTFHDIQGAYEILSDPEKKQQYDQFGAAAFDPNGNPSGGNPFAGGNPFGGAAGGNPFGGSAGNPFGGFNINFEDLFGSAFRGAGQNSYATEFTGSNIEILKQISLKEAVFGLKNAKIDYTALDGCKTCNSTGLKNGKKKSTCQTCGGTGSQVHYTHGGYQMASTCRSCEGSGVTINPSDACRTCHGEGVSEDHKTTEVDLPPGLLDGQALRLSGYGDSPRVTAGPGIHLRKGDLNIRIRIKPDQRFQIKGNNIIYNAEIPFTTAALGGIVEVPTVDGPTVRLRVTQGTESGSSTSISGKGFPKRNDIKNRGDLIVNYKVKIPRPTSGVQTALLEALAEQIGDTTAKRSNTWSSGSTTTNDQNDKTNTQDVSDKDHPSNLKKIENFLSDAFKKITKKTEDK